MNLSYALKQFYFQSKFYVVFSLFQLIVTSSLIIYILRDFHTNLKSREVFLIETFILVIMILDIVVYKVINGADLNFFAIFEVSIIFLSIVTFIYIIVNGVNTGNEQMELSLMAFRFMLQIFRLAIGIARVKQHSDKRSATLDIDLKVDENRLDNSSKDFVTLVDL